MRRSIPMALVFGLLAAACSGEGPTLVTAQPGPTAAPTSAILEPSLEGEVEVRVEEPTSTETPTQPTPAPTADSTAVPEATAEPTATTAAQGSCTTPIAGAAQDVSTVAVDFDGDAVQDQLTVYNEGDGNWRIRVETGAGESLDNPLVVGPGPASGVGALGGADLGGDTADQELLAVVGSGASALIVAAYTRDGCDLLPVTIDGAPASFPIGGSVGNISGLQCLDSDDDDATDSLVVWSGQADFETADGQYVVEGTEYHLQGTTLSEVGTRSLSANIGQADFVYGQLSCGSVNL